MNDKTAPLKLGILGCAVINDWAVFQPARNDDAIQNVAIASRDLAKARRFAEQENIPFAYGDYDALLADHKAEAIFVPLPNGMHKEWTIKALRAGYPVLCEKPFCANAAEAEEMAAVARETGLPLVEAVHWRFHPLAQRVRDLVESGTIGAIKRIEAWLHIPPKIFAPDNVRFSWDLAGGSMMDGGCYGVSFLRWVARAEPEVIWAQAELLSPQIDGAMSAEFRFPNGIEGRVESSMNRPLDAVDSKARIIGEDGIIEVTQPFVPHFGCSLAILRGGERIEETVTQTPSYEFQARAFAKLARGKVDEAALQDAINQMKTVDAVYRAAGLSVRGAK